MAEMKTKVEAAAVVVVASATATAANRSWCAFARSYANRDLLRWPLPLPLLQLTGRFCIVRFSCAIVPRCLSVPWSSLATITGHSPDNRICSVGHVLPSFSGSQQVLYFSCRCTVQKCMIPLSAFCILASHSAPLLQCWLPFILMRLAAK